MALLRELPQQLSRLAMNGPRAVRELRVCLGGLKAAFF